MRTAILGIVFGILAALFIGNVKTGDVGQWENSDPALRGWRHSGYVFCFVQTGDA